MSAVGVCAPAAFTLIATHCGAYTGLIGEGDKDRERGREREREECTGYPH